MWLANMAMSFQVMFPENVDLEDIDRRVDQEWRDFTMTQAVLVEVQFVRRQSAKAGAT